MIQCLASIFKREEAMKFLNTVRAVFPFLLFLATNSYAVHATSGFGKTHFIVGADSAQVTRQRTGARVRRSLQIPSDADQIAQVFFAPDDDAQGILIDLIASEKKAIFVAAFLLTDAAIAKALAMAKRRGVDVQVITDKVCCRSKYGQAGVLQRSGVDVFVYQPQKKDVRHMSNIMHNKFIVFHDNLLGRALVWTGSFNFTNSARLRNQENIVLLDNNFVVAQYNRRFTFLKEQCVRYETTDFHKIVKTKQRKKMGGGKKRSIQTAKMTRKINEKRRTGVHDKTS